MIQQGTKHEDTGWKEDVNLQQTMRKNSPLHDDLWDLSFVQVGLVKCPIVEQGYVAVKEKLQVGKEGSRSHLGTI
ncbi:hypothetical protein SUGI_0113510 [Cryptomeria japonica]|nr:hypothetical protein SUGI_0113510 [Cryptomeria japonica]